MENFGNQRSRILTIPVGMARTWFIVILWGWNVKGKISHICQITETDKSLKRVKIKASDYKRIGDRIKIEKL